MKIAYITGDISPNGNFTFFHDLLSNYPTPTAEWNHRVYLIAPTWDRGLVHNLKERGIDVRACFEDFQPTTDIYWDKIRRDTADCDVIISGNITNLDEVLHDNISIPIVSLSRAQIGYKSPTGTYGSFYKPRFRKAAISQTAIEAFPDHVRSEATVICNGIDPSRLTQKIQRDEVRNNLFPSRSKTIPEIKLALFIGAHRPSKGLVKLVSALDYLPTEWTILILSPPKGFKDIPSHLTHRVVLCNPTYDVADIYLACDCFVLPTEHEGLSTALLEAWFLEVPVVTTRHKAMLELISKHNDTDFGSLVDVEVSPKELAESILLATKSPNASKCMYQNYMASNMVDNWKIYLESLKGN